MGEFHITKTWMGDFAADTPKPSKIYSTLQGSGALARGRPTPSGLPSQTAEIRFVNGVKQVNGISSELKKSQTYTTPFADAVFGCWSSAPDLDYNDDSDESVCSDDDDFWEDAQLEPLCTTMGVPANQKIF